MDSDIVGMFRPIRVDHTDFFKWLLKLFNSIRTAPAVVPEAPTACQVPVITLLKCETNLFVMSINLKSQCQTLLMLLALGSETFQVAVDDVDHFLELVVLELTHF